VELPEEPKSSSESNEVNLEGDETSLDEGDSLDHLDDDDSKKADL